MASIFSKIVAGEISCYKVAEDEHHLAFLDILPIAKGHVLVIPKKEVDKIWDLSDEEFLLLQLFAKRVAKRMEEVFPCKRIGAAVVGLEVPHAHIHLVPMNEIGDISFTKERLKFTTEEYQQMVKAMMGI
jgi:histidine triad (HIT) family protein